MIRITIDLARPLVPQLTAAVEAIGRGEVVAFPTDTLYGLAVDPRSDAALDALFALKGRSADRSGRADCRQSARRPRTLPRSPARRAASPSGSGRGRSRWSCRREAGWPRGRCRPRGWSASACPIIHVARALAEACGHALTATSANRHRLSGAQSARTRSPTRCRTWRCCSMRDHRRVDRPRLCSRPRRATFDCCAKARCRGVAC